MRTYNDFEKMLLKTLVDGSYSNQERFGMQLLNFERFQKCVFVSIDAVNPNLWVFKPLGETLDRNKLIADLAGIVSLLEHLENNMYIYCAHMDFTNGLIFKDGCRPDIAVLNDQFRFDHGSITFNAGEMTLHTEGGTNFQGFQCPQALSKILKHYFASQIYALPSLGNLIENDYKSLDRRSLELQIKDSKDSARMALWSIIFAVIIVPILSLFLSNCCGYTTIDKKQYQQFQKNHQMLHEQLEKINEKIDSLKCKRPIGPLLK